MPDTPSFFVHEKADCDLEEIFDYSVERFGFSRAVSYVRDIERKFNELASNPGKGKSFDPQRPHTTYLSGLNPISSITEFAKTVSRYSGSYMSECFQVAILPGIFHSLGLRGIIFPLYCQQLSLLLRTIQKSTHHSIISLLLSR